MVLKKKATFEVREYILKLFLLFSGVKVGHIGPSPLFQIKIDKLSVNCSSVKNVKQLTINEFMQNLHPKCSQQYCQNRAEHFWANILLQHCCLFAVFFVPHDMFFLPSDGSYPAPALDSSEFRSRCGTGRSKS